MMSPSRSNFVDCTKRQVGISERREIPFAEAALRTPHPRTLFDCVCDRVDAGVRARLVLIGGAAADADACYQRNAARSVMNRNERLLQPSLNSFSVFTSHLPLAVRQAAPCSQACFVPRI